MMDYSLILNFMFSSLAYNHISVVELNRTYVPKTFEGVRELNSPIKWMGGKYRLRNRIVEMLPNDHLCYVEVFGGAGWVLFAKSLSKVEVLNDINCELINFFKVVRDNTQDFIRAFDYLLVSRQLFDEYKGADLTALNDIERAARFYYLVHFSFGARMQSFIISPTGVKFVLKTLEQEVKETRARLLNSCPQSACSNTQFVTVIESTAPT